MSPDASRLTLPCSSQPEGLQELPRAPKSPLASVDACDHDRTPVRASAASELIIRSCGPARSGTRLLAENVPFPLRNAFQNVSRKRSLSRTGELVDDVTREVDLAHLLVHSSRPKTQMTPVVYIFVRAVIARRRLLPRLQGGREASLARPLRPRNTMLHFRGVSRLLPLLTCQPATCWGIPRR